MRLRLAELGFLLLLVALATWWWAQPSNLVTVDGVSLGMTRAEVAELELSPQTYVDFDAAGVVSDVRGHTLQSKGRELAQSATAAQVIELLGEPHSRRVRTLTDGRSRRDEGLFIYEDLRLWVEFEETGISYRLLARRG